MQNKALKTAAGSENFLISHHCAVIQEIVHAENRLRKTVRNKEEKS